MVGEWARGEGWGTSPETKAESREQRFFEEALSQRVPAGPGAKRGGGKREGREARDRSGGMRLCAFSSVVTNCIGDRLKICVAKAADE